MAALNNILGDRVEMTHSKISFFLLLVLSGMSFQAMAEDEASKSALKTEAIHIVKTFGGMLKPKLKGAIQSGGLVHAINVCSVEAPKIAKSLSEDTGWSIKRVSLKARNKSSATPDVFERMVLAQFDERQASGELASAMMCAEIVDNKYRFMKAQGVEGICLSCHGASLQPDVKQAISKFYPEDAATDYSLGQIRGAFSLVKVL